MTIFPEFVITEILHPVGCEKCQKLAESAASFAKVRGSIGCTDLEKHVDPQTNEAILKHSATVRRISYLESCKKEGKEPV